MLRALFVLRDLAESIGLRVVVSASQYPIVAAAHRYSLNSSELLEASMFRSKMVIIFRSLDVDILPVARAEH
ncbi:MAG: hypothetical protein ACK58T_16690 [Phycisphaerae bacterium]